jgi:hypothetical protein
MNVKMTQAWGWLVAGVLAAGLNASYHDGGLQWAHQMAEQLSYQVEHRSAAVLDLATGHADRFVSEARLLATQDETPFSPAATVLAEVETKIQTKVQAKVQAKVARSKDRIDQTKLDQARLDQTKFDQATLASSRFDRFEAISDRQEAELERLAAKRTRLVDQVAARIEARTAHFRMTTANFAPDALKGIPASFACSRIRVSVPRLPMTMIRVPAPAIDIESGAGPI